MAWLCIPKQDILSPPRVAQLELFGLGLRAGLEGSPWAESIPNMSISAHSSDFGSYELSNQIEAFILELLRKHQQPSARELLDVVERELGIEARWNLRAVMESLLTGPKATRAERDYLRSMMDDGSLAQALRGVDAPDRERVSSIDALLHQSNAYRSSEAFREMVEFMGRFRDYAPYNLMLVRLQNPSCSLFAAERDWRKRFRRRLKEDARPMLILAPMHPVMNKLQLGF